MVLQDADGCLHFEESVSYGFAVGLHVARGVVDEGQSDIGACALEPATKRPDEALEAGPADVVARPVAVLNIGVGEEVIGLEGV